MKFLTTSIKSLFVVLFFVMVVPSFVKAQTDTRFWFAAPDVSFGHGDRPIRIVVSAFDAPAVVTVTQPANLAFPTYIVNVAANSSQIININPSIALIETPFDTPTPPAAQVSRTGLLVESTSKITAYYEVNNNTNNDIFALKGNNALGTDFYIPFQNTWRHQPNLAPNGRSGFVVVATEDATTITVTPTRTLEGGQVLNVPFTVLLNKGETYVGSVAQPVAGGFPSGSRIQSNKPVAVTKFSDSINTASGGCFDLAGDQMIPVDVLGTEYVVLRGQLGSGASNPELVVITAIADNTEVRVNGVLVATLARSQTHTYSLATARVFVSTTNPAYVGHYAGYGCETGFAILPPVTCTGSLTTRIVRSTSENFTINLMTRGTPTGGSPIATSYDFTNNFTIKVTSGGTTTTLFSPSTTPFATSLFTQVGGSNYYSAQYTFTTTQVPTNAVVTIESTTISVNDPAGLFHLGFVNGGATSGTRYGYFSGFRALDLGNDVNISYGTNTTIVADIQATNYRWFSDAVEVQNGASNSYTVTDIQRRQTIRVVATVGDCNIQSQICVGTLEFVWDGRFSGGDLEDSNNWSKPCGGTGIPNCTIDVIIPPTPIASSALNVPSGKTLSVRNLSILSAAGINGNLNVNTGGLVNVCGNMVHNGNLNMQANSNFRFVGTGRQNYSKGTTGNGDFENLDIANTIATSTFNNVAGLTILSSSVKDLTVSTTGTLNFTRGYIVPEGYPTASGIDNSRSVVIKNKNPNAITGFNTTASATTGATDYFIAGKLNRAKNATGNYSFPVGVVIQEPSTIEEETNKNGAMLGSFTNANWLDNITYGTLACNPSPNGALRLNSVATTSPTVAATNDRLINFGTNTGNVAVGGGNARTVEIWARVTQFDGAGLFQFGNSTILNGDFALVTIARVGNDPTTDNNWGIRLNNGFALDLINLPNSLNNWNHYALTYNGSATAPEVAFYYNGILIRNYELRDISNVPAPLTTVLTNGQVGRWSGTNTLGFKGDVDELKIWSEARTTAQIRESYNQGCAANALQCPQANNLKAYYNFQDAKVTGSSTATRVVKSRTIQCPVPTFSYQRANANFTNSTPSVDNITGAFQKHVTVPPATGQTDICNANFDTDPALNNGKWNFSSFNASGSPIAVNSPYSMYLFNRDYTNYVGASTTVMQLISPPWTIPNGLCEANSPQLTGRSGFIGNMGSFATAQSQDITLLPIELLSLTATPKENAILVEWATLQEKDNYGFEVFRAEGDGEFVKIGFVESKIQGQQRQDYNLLDVEVRPNITYYYKLKQIDNNGKFSFTKVVSAKLSDDNFTELQTNTIYPNPTSDEFTLYLGGKEFVKGMKVEISLVNAIGEELEHRTVNTSIDNRFTFRMSKYPNGLYVLRIVGQTSSTIMKVIKE